MRNITSKKINRRKAASVGALPLDFPMPDADIVDLADSGKSKCTKKGCHWRFKTVEESQEHMKQHHNCTPLTCGVCGKVFGSKTGLWYHEREHKGSYRFVCGYCKQGFNRKEQFGKHLLSKHPECVE